VSSKPYLEFFYTEGDGRNATDEEKKKARDAIEAKNKTKGSAGKGDGRTLETNEDWGKSPEGGADGAK